VLINVESCATLPNGVKTLLIVGLLAALLVVAACTSTEIPGGGPSSGLPPGGSTGSPSASPSTPGAGSSGGAELTVIYSDGSNPPVTWHLICDPPGGNHPDPATACQVLERNGDRALPPVPKNKLCTQVYAGPEKATITGTWKGKPVNSQLSRNNGCETARWSQLVGLLPKPGAR
jgi:Subtilisin inhibitor-like